MSHSKSILCNPSSGKSSIISVFLRKRVVFSGSVRPSNKRTVLLSPPLILLRADATNSLYRDSNFRVSHTHLVLLRILAAAEGREEHAKPTAAAIQYQISVSLPPLPPPAPVGLLAYSVVTPRLHQLLEYRHEISRPSPPLLPPPTTTAHHRKIPRAAAPHPPPPPCLVPTWRPVSVCTAHETNSRYYKAKAAAYNCSLFLLTSPPT